FRYGLVTPATDVLGQPSYTTNNANDANPSATGFDEPYAVAVDSTHHRLFVADGDNNRVLVYNLDSADHLLDKTADVVLGQTDMFNKRCNGESEEVSASSLCEPEQVAYDSAHNRLFVADVQNARILEYNASNLTSGMAAEHVLGHAAMTTGNTCCT